MLIKQKVVVLCLQKYIKFWNLPNFLYFFSYFICFFSKIALISVFYPEKIGGVWKVVVMIADSIKIGKNKMNGIDWDDVASSG